MRPRVRAFYFFKYKNRLTKAPAAAFTADWWIADIFSTSAAERHFWWPRCNNLLLTKFLSSTLAAPNFSVFTPHNTPQSRSKYIHRVWQTVVIPLSWLLIIPQLSYRSSQLSFKRTFWVYSYKETHSFIRLLWLHVWQNYATSNVYELFKKLCNYTVSQKTSRLWHTWMDFDIFWQKCYR